MTKHELARVLRHAAAKLDTMVSDISSGMTSTKHAEVVAKEANKLRIAALDLDMQGTTPTEGVTK